MRRRRQATGATYRENPFDFERSSTDKLSLVFLISVSLIWMFTIAFDLISPESAVVPVARVIEDQSNLALLTEHLGEVIVRSTVGTLRFIRVLFSVFFDISYGTALMGMILVFACVSVLLRLMRWHSKVWSGFFLTFIIVYVIILLATSVSLMMSKDQDVAKSIADIIWNDNEKYASLQPYDEKNPAGSSGVVNLIRYYRTVEAKQRIVSNVSMETGNRRILLIVNFISVAYCLLGLYYGAQKTQFSQIETTFKDIFQIFFFFYRVVFLAIPMCGLQLLVLYLSSKTFKDLGGTSALSYVILLTGLYLNNVIFYYLTMIVAQLTAAWHWARDEARMRSRVLRQSMFSVARFHMGTIAFNATVLVPIVAAFYIAYLKGIKAGRWVGIADVLLILYMMPGIPHYSSSTTAIKGEAFAKATHSTYLAFTRKSLFCLSFIHVFSMTIIFISFCITQISGSPFIIANFAEVDYKITGLLVYQFYGLILQPFAIILYSIEKSNLFCRMVNEAHDERSAECSVMDISA